VAGTAAAYGLDKEQALRMVTLSTAEILGIAQRTGSLEAGKAANIVVSRGDLLDMASHAVEHAYIDGRSVALDGLQQRLYEKFREKYED
jgi:imidazolonepropionase-like amidohydrolase